MTSPNRVRQLLPIVISLAIIAMAVKVLMGTLAHIRVNEVLSSLEAIPVLELAVGVVLVLLLYGSLTYCEMRVAAFVDGPVSQRRAALGLMLAAPIGHMIGWGAVSGGAIRYRIYSAAGMRPLDIGKMALLAAIPYPAGLGLLLGMSLVLQSHAAADLLHVSAPLARGAGLAILALHAIYLTLVSVRREPIALGRFMLTLPPPQLTAMQYCVGITEVCCAAGVLYVLLPAGVTMPFAVFLGVYVLCILTALASSVPLGGLGVFESVILLLMPNVSPAALLGRVLAYRGLLELLPFFLSALTFLAYEVWWRLPKQRARVAAIRSARARNAP